MAPSAASDPHPDHSRPIEAAGPGGGRVRRADSPSGSTATVAAVRGSDWPIAAGADPTRPAVATGKSAGPRPPTPATSTATRARRRTPTPGATTRRRGIGRGDLAHDHHHAPPRPPRPATDDVGAVVKHARALHAARPTGSAVRSMQAIGTTAPWCGRRTPELADAALGLLADDLRDLDEACSRFRPDSELRRLERRREGPAGRGRARCCSRRWSWRSAVAVPTAGIVDPTIGSALVELGYDRDFVEHRRPGADDHVAAAPARPGWWRIRLDRGTCTVAVPTGVHVDLGPTARRSPPIARPAGSPPRSAAACWSTSVATWPWPDPAPDGRVGRRHRPQLHHPDPRVDEVVASRSVDSPPRAPPPGRWARRGAPGPPHRRPVDRPGRPVDLGAGVGAGADLPRGQRLVDGGGGVGRGRLGQPGGLGVSARLVGSDGPSSTSVTGPTGPLGAVRGTVAGDRWCSTSSDRALVHHPGHRCRGPRAADRDHGPRHRHRRPGPKSGCVAGLRPGRPAQARVGHRPGLPRPSTCSPRSSTPTSTSAGRRSSCRSLPRYQPLWTGLGTVAVDLMLAVAMSSALRQRIQCPDLAGHPLAGLRRAGRSPWPTRSARAPTPATAVDGRAGCGLCSSRSSVRTGLADRTAWPEPGRPASAARPARDSGPDAGPGGRLVAGEARRRSTGTRSPVRARARP